MKVNCIGLLKLKLWYRSHYSSAQHTWQ